MRRRINECRNVCLCWHRRNAGWLSLHLWCVLRDGNFGTNSMTPYSRFMFWWFSGALLIGIVMLSIFGRRAVGFKISGVRSHRQYFRSGAIRDKAKKLSFWVEGPGLRKEHIDELTIHNCKIVNCVMEPGSRNYYVEGDGKPIVIKNLRGSDGHLMTREEIIYWFEIWPREMDIIENAKLKRETK